MMKKINKWIRGIIPANRSLDYMDVKERSERMEQAREQARAAMAAYRAARRDYGQACDLYLEQCRKAG